MPLSFNDFIQKSVEGFHDPSDASELDEALASYAENRVADLDLETVRSVYPDFEAVVPEARGVPVDHPAIAAAIEVAIQDAVHADRGTTFAMEP